VSKLANVAKGTATVAALAAAVALPVVGGGRSSAVPIQDTVVKVSDISGAGHGSGVVIDADRKLILTNAHVARGQTEMQITGTNGCVENARVLWIAEEANDIDVALLQYYGCELPAAPIRTTPLTVGEMVTAVGYPLWLGEITSVGRVLSLSVTPPNQDYEFVTIDAVIAPGNSGGGLFDVAGNLVGLTTGMANIPSMMGGIPSGHALVTPATIFCDLIVCK
jgi:S1-C subfamily serine protease